MTEPQHLLSLEARALIERVTGLYIHSDTLIDWATKGRYGIFATRVGGRNLYTIYTDRLPQKDKSAAA